MVVNKAFRDTDKYLETPADTDNSTDPETLGPTTVDKDPETGKTTTVGALNPDNFRPSITTDDNCFPPGMPWSEFPMSELPGFGLTGLVKVELNQHDAPLQLGAYRMLAGVLKYMCNQSITNDDTSPGAGIITQVACSIVLAFNRNVSIVSLDLSNNPLCTLDQPAYNFKGVCVLSQVLAFSPLSLLTTD